MTMTDPLVAFYVSLILAGVFSIALIVLFYDPPQKPLKSEKDIAALKAWVAKGLANQDPQELRFTELFARVHRLGWEKTAATITEEDWKVIYGDT